MPITENTQTRLVLKSGSTTLTFDKGNGRVVLQRKIVIWRPRPSEAPLSQIVDVKSDVNVDRASGVEIWHTMLLHSSGEGWAFPAANKQEADNNKGAIRQFLSLP
jgi:hypothetical protein